MSVKKLETESVAPTGLAKAIWGFSALQSTTTVAYDNDNSNNDCFPGHGCFLPKCMTEVYMGECTTVSVHSK